LRTRKIAITATAAQRGREEFIQALSVCVLEIEIKLDFLILFAARFGDYGNHCED
jgi:hypothetical protein